MWLENKIRNNVNNGVFLLPLPVLTRDIFHGLDPCDEFGATESSDFERSAADILSHSELLLTLSTLFIILTKDGLLRPLNLRSLISLLMMDWSERGNINTAALVTIAQCNTLVARGSRQLIGAADWVFVTLGPLRCD